LPEPCRPPRPASARRSLFPVYPALGYLTGNRLRVCHAGSSRRSDHTSRADV
jgi:hypothetical protein